MAWAWSALGVNAAVDDTGFVEASHRALKTLIYVKAPFEDVI
jgi:hypothetical protein